MTVDEAIIRPKISFIFLFISSTLKRMRKWLRNYFDLTKGEFNGLMVLVLLIFAVSCLPNNWLWPVAVDPGMERVAEAHFRQLIEKQQQQAPAYAAAKKPYATTISAKNQVSLHRFDPNTTDLAGWQELGFSAKQAQSILKYRFKGGQFRKPEDLQKMYVVSPEAYQKLRPYIAIATLPSTGLTPNTGEQQLNYPRPEH